MSTEPDNRSARFETPGQIITRRAPTFQCGTAPGSRKESRAYHPVLNNLGEGFDAGFDLFGGNRGKAEAEVVARRVPAIEVDRPVLGSLGAAMERWLFFAEATHTVMLYYGRSEA